MDALIRRAGRGSRCLWSSGTRRGSPPRCRSACRADAVDTGQDSAKMLPSPGGVAAPLASPGKRSRGFRASIQDRSGRGAYEEEGAMKRWGMVVLGVVFLAGFVLPGAADAQCRLGGPAGQIGVQGSASGAHA